MPVYDTDNSRQYRVVGRGIKPPSSNYIVIECPFCGYTVRAYLWSLAGGGKKCKCGAIHGSFGDTSQPIKSKPKGE